MYCFKITFLKIKGKPLSTPWFIEKINNPQMLITCGKVWLQSEQNILFCGVDRICGRWFLLIDIVGLVFGNMSGLPCSEFWSIPPPGGIKRAQRAPKSTTGFTFYVFRVEWSRDKINSTKGYYEIEAQQALLKQYECNLPA